MCNSTCSTLILTIFHFRCSPVRLLIAAWLIVINRFYISYTWCFFSKNSFLCQSSGSQVTVFRDQQADEEQTKVPSLLTFSLLCLKILLWSDVSTSLWNEWKSRGWAFRSGWNAPRRGFRWVGGLWPQLFTNLSSVSLKHKTTTTQTKVSWNLGADATCAGGEQPKLWSSTRSRCLEVYLQILQYANSIEPSLNVSTEFLKFGVLGFVLFFFCFAVYVLRELTVAKLWWDFWWDGLEIIEIIEH